MPARPRLCRLTLASSPTLYVWRSARSRSFVSSFLPEIVRSPVGDDRVAEPVGAGDADDVAAPLLVLDPEASRVPCPVFASVCTALRCDLALGDAAGLVDALDDRGRERLAGRLAVGVGGGDLTGKVSPSR